VAPTAALLAVVPDERAALAAARTAALSPLPFSTVIAPNPWPAALARIEASDDTAVLVVDSRTVLLQPVGVPDLVIGGCAVAYLTEDREYWADPPPEAAERQRLLSAVRSIVGVPDGVPLWGNRGPIVFSPSVLRTLREGLLHPRGWSWDDLLDAEPDVSAWYAAWVVATGFADVEPREPAFRTCLTLGERRSLAIRGVTPDDLRRSFLGYVGEVPEPAVGGVPRSVSGDRLVRAMALRSYLRLPRVRRLVERAGLRRPER
jgi:hypothetical protein